MAFEPGSTLRFDGPLTDHSLPLLDASGSVVKVCTNWPTPYALQEANSCDIYSFLPRFALRFIRPDPRSRVTDPVGDIVSFMHSFEEKYGRAHPVFYQGTYSQVSATNQIDANLTI